MNIGSGSLGLNIPNDGNFAPTDAESGTGIVGGKVRWGINPLLANTLLAQAGFTVTWTAAKHVMQNVGAAIPLSIQNTGAGFTWNFVHNVDPFTIQYFGINGLNGTGIRIDTGNAIATAAPDFSINGSLQGNKGFVGFGISNPSDHVHIKNDVAQPQGLTIENLDPAGVPNISLQGDVNFATIFNSNSGYPNVQLTGQLILDSNVAVVQSIAQQTGGFAQYLGNSTQYYVNIPGNFTFSFLDITGATNFGFLDFTFGGVNCDVTIFAKNAVSGVAAKFLGATGDFTLQRTDAGATQIGYLLKGNGGATLARFSTSNAAVVQFGSTSPGGTLTLLSGNAVTALTFSAAQLATFAQQIQTGQGVMANAPQPWNLGQRVAAAVALDATHYLETAVNGVIVKVAIVT